MIIHLLLGSIVGVILALTGAGGGILAVPLLIFGAHLGMVQAGPIGLMAVGLAAAIGAVLGLRAGTVRYKAAALIATAGMIASPIGLWLAQHTPNRPLTGLFAVVLLFAAYRMYRKAASSTTQTIQSVPTGHDLPPCRFDATIGMLNWTMPCARALTLAGTVAGLLSGLLGVGGGFVVVPALQRFTDLTPQSVLATSLAVIALVSVSGVIASAAGGQLSWIVAFPFSAAAIAGMLGGSLVFARLAGPQLQKTFAVISALVAMALIAKASLGN